jgi:acetyl esterase/lipase
MACILGVSADHEQLNGQLGEHLEKTATVTGVLALYPPTDFLSVSRNFDGLLDYYAEDSPVTQLLGESIANAPEKANLASPLRLFKGACPPIFLLHGEADPIVPVEQSVILHEKLLAAGVDSDLMRMPGYTHGDHRFNKGAPAERINAFLKKRATA